jgi:hypothetical protein
MRVDRQIETARRDIRAEVLSILSSGGLVEFRFGCAPPPAAVLDIARADDCVTVDL